MRGPPRRAVLAGAFAAIGSRARGQGVQDSVGRTVVLTGAVRRVFPAGPPAATLLASLAPDLMAGWPRVPAPAEAAFLGPGAAALPAIGRLTGSGGAAELERALTPRPDLVLDYGSTGPAYVTLAERVRERTGVPVLLLDGALERVPEVYRLLGTALGRQPVAEARAEAASRILADARDAAAALAGHGRPRVLALVGPGDGRVAGAGASETLALAGAEVVARGSEGGGPVTAAQAAAWDPDWILSGDPDFRDRSRADAAWRGVRAVREGRVATVPALPFGWLGVPPSVNRLLGLLWLPVLFGVRSRDGFAEAVAGFHAAFYGRRPDPAALDALLAPAFPG